MSPIKPDRLFTPGKYISNLSGRLFRRAGFSSKLDHVKPQASEKARARIERITSRLPVSLRGYVAPLVNAPVSHVVSFLLLHELTAIVPLFGLAGAFHYTGWLPSLVGEGKWINEGMDKFDRYFRKKGWLGVKNEGQNISLISGRTGSIVVVEYDHTLTF